MVILGPSVLEIACTSTSLLALDPSGTIKLRISPHCWEDSGSIRKIVNSPDCASVPSYASSLESLDNMLTVASNVYTAGSVATTVEADGDRF